MGKSIARCKSVTGARMIERLTERPSPVLRLWAFHQTPYRGDREHPVGQAGSPPEPRAGEVMGTDPA